MPDPSPSNDGSLKLQLLTARKEWWPATADSLPQAVTCRLNLIFYILHRCNKCFQRLQTVFNKQSCLLFCQCQRLLLADHTNGRTYATVFRLSVTLRIVTKWCVLEQKLLLTAYMNPYTRNRLVPK